MKLLANENFPLRSTRKFENYGFDIRAIAIDSPGISDREVMEIAIQENRMILTFDRDYGELIFRYSLWPPAGVVYFRFKRFTPEFPGEYLIRLIEKGEIEFRGLFTVLDEDVIRQRKYG